MNGMLLIAMNLKLPVRGKQLLKHYQICRKQLNYILKSQQQRFSPLFIQSKQKFMPPFKPIKFNIVKRKLERLGFNIVSQKGSNIKFAKYTDKGIITAIVPNYREVSPSTLKSILKQAMVTNEEFDEA